ncbi:MAG: ATP-binding cassette domain-containing protein [Pseudomonadota bacterium]|nr:ATP-binding cassette domain-containing protein [Pseudomonadota bacterium]
MTDLLTTHHLGYLFAGGRRLLTELDISLSRGRYGLCGANGAGKTTLLQLLAGGLRASEGSVSRRGRLLYLPQQPALPPLSLLGLEGIPQALARVSAGNGTEADFDLCAGHWTLAERLSAALAGSGFCQGVLTPAELNELLTSAWQKLSGGQRQRLLLALMFALQPDILLLDEPGNELDECGRRWLQQQIRDWPGLLLVASHQPQLLTDTDAILWLQDGRVQRYGGNYADFTRQRDCQQQAALRLVDNRRQQLSALKQQTQKNHEKARRRARSGKRQRRDGSQSKMLLDKMAQSAEQHQGAHARLQQKRLQQAQSELDQARAGYAGEAEIRWPLPPQNSRSGALLQTCGLRLPRGNRAPVNLTVRAGECWHIRGDNGSGKSTLLQVLSGELSPQGGDIYRRAPLLRLDQQGLVAAEDVTALAYMQARVSAPADQLRTRMAALGLGAAHCRQPLSALSGGERMKLAILALSWQQPGAVLLLDEPDNHLDPGSRRELQRALAGWPGALLLVSHDPLFAQGCGAQHELQLS